MSNKVCQQCTIELPLREFNNDKRTSDGRAKVCRSCRRINHLAGRKRSRMTEQSKASARRRQARMRRSKRDWIGAMKVAAGCVTCGYNAHFTALAYHHRDPSTKLFTINNGLTTGKSKRALQAEIDKCDVYCLNCHALLHFRL